VMKNLLKIFFVTFLVSLSTNSQAQTNQNKENRFEQFKREMDLSDAQVLKIKAIKDKYAQEKKELKSRLEEIRVKELEEIDRLYTPEQKAKLKAIIERHKAQKNGK